MKKSFEVLVGTLVFKRLGIERAFNVISNRFKRVLFWKSVTDVTNDLHNDFRNQPERINLFIDFFCPYTMALGRIDVHIVLGRSNLISTSSQFQLTDFRWLREVVTVSDCQSISYRFDIRLDHETFFGSKCVQALLSTHRRPLRASGGAV